MSSHRFSDENVTLLRKESIYDNKYIVKEKIKTTGKFHFLPNQEHNNQKYKLCFKNVSRNHSKVCECRFREARWLSISEVVVVVIDFLTWQGQRLIIR